jgi:hypothetical protein
MGKKVLEFEFKATDSSVLASMKAQGATADQLKAKYKELAEAKNKGEEDKGGDSVLKNLKSQLGARSSLGQIGKIAVGGGAVAGLTLIANAIGGAAKEAKELRDQFRNGTISAGEMKEKMIEAVPVFGQVWAAGQQIRELLSSFPSLANSAFGKLIGLDQIADAEKINREEAARKVLLDYQGESIERAKKSLREQQEILRGINSTTGGIGKQGYDKEKYDAQVEAQNKLASLSNKHQEDLEAAEKRRAEAAKKLQEDKSLDPATKFDAEQQLQKQFNGEKLKINKDYADTYHAQNGQNYVEALDLEKRHQESMRLLLQGESKETSDIIANSQIERLKALGHDLDAEYALVAKNAQDKKDAVLKALAEQLKGADLADQDRLRKAATAQIGAIDNGAAGEQQNLTHKTLLDAQLKVLQAQGNAGNYLAANEAKRVQAARELEQEQARLLAVYHDINASDEQRNYAAAAYNALKQAATADTSKALDDEELTILQEQAAAGDHVAEAELKRVEAQRSYNEEAAKLTAILQDQKSTIEQQGRAKAELAQLDQAQTQAVGKALRDQNTALLQQQSTFGRTANERRQAELQLTSQKLKDEFAQREAEAQSILANANATKEQKQAALDNLKAFAKDAGAEMDKEQLKDRKEQKHSFDAQERGLLLTGVAAGALAHRDPQEDVVKNTAEGNKLTADLLKQMGKLIGVLTPKGGSKPQPVFSNK